VATCSFCGRSHDATEWRALELVDRIGRDRLDDVVTDWPHDSSIEIRLCPCGKPMARLPYGQFASGPENSAK
jgi:hypothetical protein